MNKMKKQVDNQVKWITQLTYDDIPEDVIIRAKWVLLDSIGCILNGLGDKKLPPDTNAKILKSTAAMVSTELYEGNRFAIGHPASHIVPILLQEMENKDISYGEALKLFVSAYEIASRWGSSIRFSNDILGHGTVMISGAATVEGMLFELSEQDFTNYLMTCESLPEVSTWQSVFDGSALHDYYPGIAAVNAKNALYMTSENVQSSEELIRSIYDKVIGAKVVEENLSSDLEDQWYLAKNYFKVHTGCRFIHPFADVIENQLKNGLKKDEIKEIYIYTYKKAARLTSQTVSTELAAKFSIPVSIATLIIRGQLYPEDVAEGIKNSEIKELSSHIYLMEDDKYNTMLPDIRGGRVEITKKNGETIIEEVFHAKGDFDNPEKFSEEKLIAKFYKITEKSLEKFKQENLVKNILTGSKSVPAKEIFKNYYEAI